MEHGGSEAQTSTEHTGGWARDSTRFDPTLAHDATEAEASNPEIEYVADIINDSEAVLGCFFREWYEPFGSSERLEEEFSARMEDLLDSSTQLLHRRRQQQAALASSLLHIHSLLSGVSPTPTHTAQEPDSE